MAPACQPCSWTRSDVPRTLGEPSTLHGALAKTVNVSLRVFGHVGSNSSADKKRSSHSSELVLPWALAQQRRGAVIAAAQERRDFSVSHARARRELIIGAARNHREDLLVRAQTERDQIIAKAQNDRDRHR